MTCPSLDELKAKLEQAQKENIILKTEKLERENITMKLEKIEAENAALRNEAKVDKTPTASIPSQKTAAAATNTPSPEAKTVARREPVETSAPTPRERVAAHREINRALDNIPKDDARREMTAVQKAQITSEIILEKPWQGIYAGINAGYGEGQANYSGYEAGPAQAYPCPGFAMCSNYISNSYPTFYYFNGVNNLSGPVAGGQIGYNHQFKNHIMAGAEIDLDYADIDNRYATPGSNNSVSANQGQINKGGYYDRTGVNWLGTARLRIGYDLGKFMPYITAGFAYGSVSNNSLAYQNYISIWNNAATLQAGGSETNNSSLNIGWVAGGGAEYMVADNWSVKGEYLFTQLGNLNVSAYPTAISTGNNLAGSSSLNGMIGPWSIHQARVGLNYHIGWLGSAPTVTAKY